METPQPTGIDGRSANRRFVAGKESAKGNPFNKKAQQRRNAFLETVTPEPVIEVTKELLAPAKAGDIHTRKVLLDCWLGMPSVSSELA